MTKWHIISRLYFVVSVASILWLLFNIFAFSTTNVGLNAFADLHSLVESLCKYVSPIILLFQLIGCLIYGIVQRQSTDYTLRTLFYQILALTVINFVLMCFPENNVVTEVMQFREKMGW